MRLPPTERLFWHCGARTAKPDSAPKGRFVAGKICCFSVARGGVCGDRHASASRMCPHFQETHERRVLQKTVEVSGTQNRRHGAVISALPRRLPGGGTAPSLIPAVCRAWVRRAESSAKCSEALCSTHSERCKKQPQCGVIPRLRVPGTIPGGYPEYPDQLRVGVLTVVMI